MVGKSFDFLDVVVLDQGRLVGLIAASRLLEAREDALLRDVVESEPVVIRPGDSEETAAWRMVRRGQSNLAVVGADGSFVGIVPPHALIGRLLAQHDKDAARLGGYLASTGRARLAAEEPIRRRLLHRLPWLLVGLVGAMASAVLVGSFETQLDARVLLAFFVPAVVYMADAVGTQTETLLIRGMSASRSPRNRIGSPSLPLPSRRSSAVLSLNWRGRPRWRLSIAARRRTAHCPRSRPAPASATGCGRRLSRLRRCDAAMS